MWLIIFNKGIYILSRAYQNPKKSVYGLFLGKQGMYTEYKMPNLLHGQAQACALLVHIML